MQDISSIEKRYWKISLWTPVKKILEIAVLKLVKGRHKKQHSHQVVDNRLRNLHLETVSDDSDAEYQINDSPGLSIHLVPGQAGTVYCLIAK